jgi:hypothetical protein
MGVVWLARDERLERPVALKFLPEIVRLDPGAVKELKRETQRSLELTHPHIVRIYDYVEDGELAAISMEYADGPTLTALRVAKTSDVFEVREARRPPSPRPWRTGEPEPESTIRNPQSEVWLSKRKRAVAIAAVVLLLVACWAGLQSGVKPWQTARERKAQLARLNAEKQAQAVEGDVIDRYAKASVAREILNKAGIGRGEGLGAKLDELELEWRKAEAARQGKNWGVALGAYDEVLRRSGEVGRLDTERREARAVEASAKRAREEAAVGRASEDAPVLWVEAERSWKSAAEGRGGAEGGSRAAVGDSAR